MSSEVDTNYFDVNNEKVRANGAWITNEFVQGVVAQLENDEDVRVVDSKVNAAVGVGDNYMSIMYQMTAEWVRGKTGERERCQFLIKGFPTAKILCAMVEEYGLFRKELYLYSTCLPAMRRFMEEYLPDEEDFIAARSYACAYPDVLVLEDLKLRGYKMAKRRELLDYDHTSVTLRSLARFHALSAKLVREKPEVLEVVSRDEIYSEEKRTNLYSHVLKGVNSWLKVMKGEERLSRFVPEIEKAIAGILDKVIQVVSKKEGSFVCINHGDSWTNNFMYRYDNDGSVCHAKLVDFQLVRYSSPVLDLLYFLTSSTQPDMLAERFFDLIEIYHGALVSDLEKLEIDSSELPSLDDVHRELRDRSIFGLTTLMVLTPIVVAKPSDTADFENMEMEDLVDSPDYVLEKNFRDDYYKELVIKYLGIFEKLGYLKSAQELVVGKSNGE